MSTIHKCSFSTKATELDPQTCVAIWEYLETLNRDEGVTIFLTTQQTEKADKLNQRLVMSGLAMAIGLTTKNPEAVAGVDLTIIFPLLVVSAALMAYKFLPGWAQAFSNVNPLSYVVDAVRVLMSTDLRGAPFSPRLRT